MGIVLHPKLPSGPTDYDSCEGRNQNHPIMLFVAGLGSVLIVPGLIQAFDAAGDSSIMYRGWSTIVFGISIVILSRSTIQSARRSFRHTVPFEQET